MEVGARGTEILQSGIKWIKHEKRPVGKHKRKLAAGKLRMEFYMEEKQLAKEKGKVKGERGKEKEK